MFAAVIALAWANSPWSEHYHSLWNSRLNTGPELLQKPLSFWISEGLMTLFFLVVGLEIKREFVNGELSSRSARVLPIAAALGGMLAPALIYVLLLPTGPGAAGWGIPMATDIAFSLGVLSLLGKGVPIALKLFLTGYAIVDDLGAVVVISLFYTSDLQPWALVSSGLVVAGMWWMSRSRWQPVFAFVLLGCVLWYLFHSAGIHPTVAGVIVAFFLPQRAPGRGGSGAPNSDERSAGESVEHALERPVGWVIAPLFGLANAGIDISGSMRMDGIALAVFLGLCVGKPIGVIGGVWIATKAKLCRLPDELGYRHIVGAAILGGIGFTMSIFIGGLAFDDSTAHSSAKLGIIAASVFSAIVGATVLAGSLRNKGATG